MALILGHHYLEAGEGQKALPYLLQTGDQARHLYAHQQAINNYQQALEILEEKGELDQAARLLMKLGLTHHNAFQFEAARQSYDKGFILWQRARTAKRSETPSRSPHPLRLLKSEPITLDPSLATDMRSQIIYDQLFSSLVELNSEMDIVPDISHSWKVFDGGRRYIFHLRDDVAWSDGVQVTAADYEFAWRRILSPVNASSDAPRFYDIKGAKAFHQGQTSDSDTVGIRSLDDLTLEVELERPVSYFLQILADAHPMPSHVVNTPGSSWTDPDKIVTNGPFQLADWKPGKSMILKRYLDYHGRFNGNLSSIQINFQPAVDGEVAMYINNQVDILELSGLNMAEFRQLRQSRATEYFTVPMFRTFYLAFDHRRPPFDDPRVRRAFALAIDRDALADAILGGTVFPANGGFVPPGMAGHTSGISLPYDPAKARRLLAESGFPQGLGFPRMECISVGFERAATIPHMAKQWQENLGVEITRQEISLTAFRERLNRERPFMWVMGWQGDFPDPDNFLTQSEWRFQSGWQNKTFEQLIAEASRLLDQRKRVELYHEAERLLVEEAAVIPIYYDRSHYLLKPWIRSFPSSGLKNWYWKDVIIEPH